MLDSQQTRKRHEITWRLPSWKYALLLIFLVLAVTSIVPTTAETGRTCPIDDNPQNNNWMGFPKPDSMVHWLWSDARKHEVAAEYPQLNPDLTKTESPLLFNLVSNNTDIAIHLAEEFKYGIGVSQGSQSEIVPYSELGWDPWEISQEIGNGSVLGQWNCLHNEWAFDERVSEATINLEHTMPWIGYDGRGRRDFQVLDPKVYGNNPYIMFGLEPGYVLRRDGHIVFGVPGTCPVNALYYYDENGKLTYQENVVKAGCMGGVYITLIVPEPVKITVGKQVLANYTLKKMLCQMPDELDPAICGLSVAMHMEGFLTVVWSDTLNAILSAEHPDFAGRLEPNWKGWQTAYRILMPALNAYSKSSGLNYNFTRFTRFPYDTRLPENIRSKIIWESFPTPVEEMMPPFADSSVTLTGLYQCARGDDAGCPPATGQQLASTYAMRIYEYLQKYGAFTWAQSIIRPWLVHYIDNASIGKLRDFDAKVVKGTKTSVGIGLYTKFQYKDAFKYLKQPSQIGFTKSKTAESISNTGSGNLQAFNTNPVYVGLITQAQNSPAISTIQEGPRSNDAPEENAAITPLNYTMQMSPQQQSTQTVPTVLISSFGGGILFVQRVSGNEVDEEPLEEGNATLYSEIQNLVYQIETDNAEG